MRQFLHQNIQQNIQQVVWHPVDEWLTDHPLWQWFLLHPLVLLTVCVTTLILLAGLVSAIAHLTQNLWLQLLRFPIRLVQWLGKAIATVVQYGLVQPVLARTLPSRHPSSNQQPSFDAPRAINEVPSIPATSVSSLKPSQQMELEHLLDRLEKVHQEEVDLMEKIKALIRQQSTP